MGPVRPWVDQWVWRLLESRALNPEDFTETAAQGCRLSKEGRAVFFREWYRSEDEWLPKPARHALAIVLTQLRPLTNPRALPEYDSTVQDDRELIEF
ncbi:MAG: CRISPR-associated endonuclease Cas1 [Methylococcales bacterium]